MKQFEVQIVTVTTKKTKVTVQANDTIEASKKAIDYANDTKLLYRVPFYIDIINNVVNMPIEVDIYDNPIK